MTTPAKLTREQIEWYRTHIVHRAQGGLLSDDGITSICDLAIAGLDAEKVATVAKELLDEAERRIMGFPSKWTKVEAWFAFRDHAKAAIAAYQASKEKP